MRTSASSLVFLLLALMTVTFASPFWARQEAPAEDLTAAAAVSSISEAEASASATDTVSPAAGSSATATETAPPAAQTNANGTSAATSTSGDGAAATSSSSTSSSVTPTPTVSCHKSSSSRPDDHIQNPFCEPKPGQKLIVGQTYPLTWDPTLFEFDSTNSIRLTTVTSADAEGVTNNTVIWKQDGVRNENGQVPNFQIKAEDFQDFNLKNNTNLTLFMSSDPSDAPVWSGPTLTLILDAKIALNGTKGGNGNNHIGEKAGIPVGLGVFLIAVAGLVFWFLRRRRNKSAGYMAKRKGTSSRMTGDESGVGGGGFTDEPTRGMELQDRQGHGRQDSWEAGWDSTSSQGGGGGGGNTFRDEIDRQRRR
ncbi:MAG: hypothetical protein LQ339_002695 [Xanthoria mediterranea]|nr:MAG: hypothetical protein LQ339_002695 [Xanthoria mediterranea]